MVKVVGLDHVVVNVSDVERSVAWYVDKLGVEPLRLEEWRRGEVFFPSGRIAADTIIDFMPGERSGTNVDHFCLVIEPTDLEAVKASGDLDVVEGPTTRWGARGEGAVLYVRDPDGNLVELRHYG